MRSSSLAIWLAFAVAAAGLLAGPAAEARGYTRCPQCGGVIDVDPILYDETDKNRGAADGTIVAGVLGNRPDTGRQSGVIAGVSVDGLIGRRVKRSVTSPGKPGTRLEVKLDAGGHVIVEVAGRVRLYRDDRVRMKDGRIDLYD